MADKKLIEEFNLSEAVKRFQQINEYTFISSPPLTEDGDENSQNNNQQQPQDGANGEDNGQQQIQNDSTNQPITNSQNIGNQQMQNIQSVQAQDTTNGVDMQPEPSEVMNNVSQMQPDDEVIDVDDLTNTQEETAEKVDGVNTKLLRLLKVVSKYTDAINRQNKEIEDLKTEFERRNPTEEERLNIRSQAGYPYSEQPKDYWDKKTKENPNYNIIYNNDASSDKEQDQFEIKRKDLNGMNYREIADSFDEYPQSLSDYIN